MYYFKLELKQIFYSLLSFIIFEGNIVFLTEVSILGDDFFMFLLPSIFILPPCPTAVQAFQGLNRAAYDSSSLVCQFSYVLLDFGFVF